MPQAPRSSSDLQAAQILATRQRPSHCKPGAVRPIEDHWNQSKHWTLTERMTKHRTKHKPAEKIKQKVLHPSDPIKITSQRWKLLKPKNVSASFSACLQHTVGSAFPERNWQASYAEKRWKTTCSKTWRISESSCFKVVENAAFQIESLSRPISAGLLYCTSGDFEEISRLYSLHLSTLYLLFSLLHSSLYSTHLYFLSTHLYSCLLFSLIYFLYT